jgi:hypothetical protein
MAAIGVRWSEHEAPKPYARPFMVSFTGDGGVSLGAVAVSGADLLYYRQFQAAVLALSGELFVHPEVDADADPQRAWLDELSGLLPSIASLSLRPASTFDHERGRVFRVEAMIPGHPEPMPLEASAVLEYQDLQAALAHQSGRLYRSGGVEAVADPSDRHRVWLAALGGLLERPDADEAMTVDWPWHPRPVR